MEDEKSGLNEMNSSEQKHEQQYEEASEKSVTRVAVVGTGLAGLSTAYLLDQDKQKRFSVTVFEKVCCAHRLVSGICPFPLSISSILLGLRR